MAGLSHFRKRKRCLLERLSHLLHLLHKVSVFSFKRGLWLQGRARSDSSVESEILLARISLLVFVHKFNILLFEYHLLLLSKLLLQFREF